MRLAISRGSRALVVSACVSLLATVFSCGSNESSPGSGKSTGGAGGSVNSNSGGNASTTGGTAGALAGATGDAGKSGAAGNTSSSAVRIRRTRTEYRVNPLGIDVKRPRLEWQLESEQRGQRQTAYQVLVATSEQTLSQNVGDLWDSGKVESDQSIQVAYQGKPLVARQRAVWKVRVWDKDDVASDFSEPAFWEMGLLERSDWKAKWLAAPPMGLSTNGVKWIWYPEANPPAADRSFRKAFSVSDSANVERATCTITADNEFELFVNGTRVGGGSNWQDVSTFEIGSLLVTGSNVVAVRARNVDGPAGLVSNTTITPKSGSPIYVNSDNTWKVSTSGAGAWNNRTFDDTGWQSTQELAAFGGAPWGNPGGSVPAYLRRPFSLAKEVRKARVYVTALGLYELYVNGERVGTDRLTPGWTDYRKRVQVQSYDVTKLVKTGNNAIGAIIADGWFGGKVGFQGRTRAFGDGPNRLFLQLEVEASDGSIQTISSGDSEAWKSNAGPILAADLLDGEIYDARLEQPDWSTAEFNDSVWAAARVFDDTSTRVFVADATDHVRAFSELKSVSVNEVKPGVFIFDIGQNITGWARLRVNGAAGTTLTLRFGEVLNTDGTLYVENLRSDPPIPGYAGAKATDKYTLRGGSEEVFEPRFTTHGYRYVELTGDIAKLKNKPDVTTITGIAASSDTPPVGSLETSSAMVNRLVQNIVWSQRDNFVSVPTDCPQRDERLGWLGDAQVFVRTATLNMDVASFFTKWMRDVSEAQLPSGSFTEVAPNPNLGGNSTPAWGDAGTIVPWTIYLAYGDTRILDEHYTAMTRWVEYIKGANPDFLWKNQRGSDYGDWLSIDADTDKELLATAFYAHSVDIVARSARILGKDVDAQKYEALFDSIKTAFNSAYVDADTKLKSDTQTAYALALRFNLLPNDRRAAAAERLAANVKARGHLSSGFIGVGHLLPALTSGGKTDVAYQLLVNESFPSWFYEIKRGATSIWERWNGIKEDGKFNDALMNSFNHYSFGAVGEWMYETIAGIQLDETAPAYKRFRIAPIPGANLTSARGQLNTPYGPIVSDWRIESTTFTLKISVPVNATASLRLPFSKDIKQEGTALTPQSDGSYDLESGSYTFSASTN